MKWAASFAAAAAAALFGPVTAGPVQRAGLAHYRLRVSYKGLEGIDGAYLSIKDGAVGIHQSLPTAAPVQFYTTAGASRGTYEMHTYPTGIVDHALGLVGKQGLFRFVDMANPAATSFVQGTTALWSEWGLDNYPPLVIQDTVECVPVESSEGAESPAPTTVPRRNLVEYDGEGRGNEHAGWQAFPAKGRGDWDIFWNNGSAIVTTDYMPINVVWEADPIKCA